MIDYLYQHPKDSKTHKSDQRRINIISLSLFLLALILTVAGCRSVLGYHPESSSISYSGIPLFVSTLLVGAIVLTLAIMSSIVAFEVYFKYNTANAPLTKTNHPVIYAKLMSFADHDDKVNNMVNQWSDSETGLLCGDYLLIEEYIRQKTSIDSFDKDHEVFQCLTC